MADSLLIQTLRCLDPKERQQFQEFAESRCHNRNADVARLCTHVIAHIGKRDHKGLEPERLFAAVFPERAYDNGVLRHLLSYLLDVLRQYLAWVEWQSDEGEQQRYLIRALHRRRADALFDKEWQRAYAAMAQMQRRDARYHFRQYQLHEEYLEHLARHERSVQVDLQPLPDELTTFYVGEMLRHACAALSQQAIAGQEYRFALLDKLLEAVDTTSIVQAPVVALYFHAYKMLLSAHDSEHFEQMKQMLASHGDKFSPEEMRGLYLLAINGCIRRMNTGRRAYIREAFDLYRVALEHEFLQENGLITGFTYKNVIRIGTALGEHEWVETFLEQYKTRLHPRERDDHYRYNRAYCYFQKQDYTRAMPLLQQTEFDDPLNSLDARRMLLRSYFEMGEWSALDSLLQSFSAYLRRQKKIGYHLQTNQNLLYFTKKLMDARQGDRDVLTKIRAELEQTPDVAERAWLLAQLE